MKKFEDKLKKQIFETDRVCEEGGNDDQEFEQYFEEYIRPLVDRLKLLCFFNSYVANRTDK